MKKRWTDFPIYIIEDAELGERHILPNDLVILRAERNRDAAEVKYKEAESAGASIDVISKLRLTFEDRSRYVQTLTDTTPYREAAERKLFMIATPTFGEYQHIEEVARIFVGDAQQVDNSVFMLNLLIGNVQEGGNILTKEDVQALDTSVAKSLYEEIYARCFPDPRRIPTLASRLTA